MLPDPEVLLLQLNLSTDDGCEAPCHFHGSVLLYMLSDAI